MASDRKAAAEALQMRSGRGQDADGDCLCPVVTDAPLRLTGRIGSLFNFLMRFQRTVRRRKRSRAFT